MNNSNEQLKAIFAHPNRKILDAGWAIAPRTPGDELQVWKAIALFKYASDAHEWGAWRQANLSEDEKKARTKLIFGPVVFHMGLIDQGSEANTIDLFQGSEVGPCLFRECWAVLPIPVILPFVAPEVEQGGQPWDALALFLEEAHAHLWLEQRCDPRCYRVRRVRWDFKVEERERSRFNHAMEGATLD